MATNQTYVVGGNRYYSGTNLDDGVVDTGIPPFSRPEVTTTPGAVPPGPSAEDKYWTDRAQYEADQRANQVNGLISVTRDYFRNAGMEAFINGMEKYVRMGYSGDAVMVMLGNDPDYKAAWDTRFAGNAARRANGLSELLPAQYVAIEQGYKQLMLQYSAPATLFDSADDFAELIGKDVSVAEVNDRLARASDYMNYSGNDNVKAQLRDVWGMTDDEMFAHVLDAKRTNDYLDSESRRNMNRANVGGAAITAGVNVASSFRDEIAGYYNAVNSSYTSTYADATDKFGTVARENPLYQRLGQLSSVATSSDELVRGEFGLEGAAGVDRKKKSLAADERGRFSGQSGLGAKSLSVGRRAQ